MKLIYIEFALFLRRRIIKDVYSINHLLPGNGAHTNTIENMWMHTKHRNKRECGTARGMVDTYLIEFMWQLNFGENPFENNIKDIQRLYSV